MNQRILKIAEMVDQGAVLADIGTDHGQLCIVLAQKRWIKKAYACDVAHGPLCAAQKNIQSAGVEDRVKTILSDGFDQVPMDADCAVIAGMGYRTIAGILERAHERLDSFSKIILEANDDPIAMRQWLSDQKMSIIDETFLFDKGKPYTIIAMTTQKREAYSPEDIVLGPVLKQKAEHDWLLYCGQRQEKLSALLALKKEGPEREQLEEELRYYQKLKEKA